MTRCIPNADKVAKEVLHVAEKTSVRHLQMDADFITGILFVVEESGLTDITELREKLIDSAREGDVDNFKRAAYKVSAKIKSITCDDFEYREI